MAALAITQFFAGLNAVHYLAIPGLSSREGTTANRCVLVGGAAGRL